MSEENVEVFRMNLRRRVLFLIVAALMVSVPSFAAELATLFDKRSVALWYEGEALGDLIIGARAQFTFVYVDRALSQAAVKDAGAPDWLRDNAYFFGSEKTGKKALFIVRLDTKKNLDLELEMIKIGSHVITQQDVLTNKHYVPVGELPAGFSGDFAVAVPLEAVRGAARRVSVGDYEAELEFPIK